MRSGVKGEKARDLKEERFFWPTVKNCKIRIQDRHNIELLKTHFEEEKTGLFEIMCELLNPSDSKTHSMDMHNKNTFIICSETVPKVWQMSPRGNIKLNKSADVENQHTFKTKLALSPTAMCMCHSATERGRQQVPLFAYAPFYNKVIPLKLWANMQWYVNTHDRATETNYSDLWTLERCVTVCRHEITAKNIEFFHRLDVISWLCASKAHKVTLYCPVCVHIYVPCARL